MVLSYLRYRAIKYRFLFVHQLVAMGDKMDVDLTPLRLQFVLVANGRAFVSEGDTTVGVGQVKLPPSSPLSELRREIVNESKPLLDNIPPHRLIVYPTTRLNREGSKELLTKLRSMVANPNSATLTFNEPTYSRMDDLDLLQDIFEPAYIDPRAIHLIVDCTDASK